MCDLPKRCWRASLTPTRMVLGLLAVAVAGTAVVLGNRTGLVLLAVSVALLLAAVADPVVRQVEFGLPYAVRFVAAVQDREEQLRREFLLERPDLELCAQLLCDDADWAPRLLEAAWSKAAATWRGPVGPAMRVYVLCLLLHLLAARERWLASTAAVRRGDPLNALSLDDRIVVVLDEFAGLARADIAVLTGRPVHELEDALRRAGQVLSAEWPPTGTS